MTYQEMLLFIEEELQDSGIEEFKSDAWILFSECFDMSRVDFMMKCIGDGDEGDEVKWQQLLEWTALRKTGVPVQYITHVQNFYGYDFYVDENVLIPRMDTEVLVETIINVMQQEMLKKQSVSCGKLLDVCTGSGCIAISLANMLEWDAVEGVDISTGALEVAKKNGTVYDNKVKFYESDVFSNVQDQYDVIVSNPPYIESAVIETLATEVKDHEPRLALDGTEDGLFFYRKIIAEAKQYLKKEGLLFFEIGADQGNAVKQLFYENEFKDVRIVADLAGLDRVVYARL